MSFAQTEERNIFIAEYLHGKLESFSLQNKNFYCITFNNEIGKELSSLVEFDSNSITPEHLEHLKTISKQKINFRIQPSKAGICGKTLKLLLLRGYCSQLSFTSLLDLEQSQEILWSNLRKSFKSLINKESKKVTTKFYHGSSNESFIFDNWINLYSNAIRRGNKQLTPKAIESMHDAIKKDMGFIVCAYEDEKLLGAILFNHHNSLAYYSAAANSDDIEGDTTRYIGHLLMWEGIKKLKAIQCTELEIGPLDFENQPHSNHDTKILNITNFKLGFGGEVTPVFNFTKVI